MYLQNGFVCFMGYTPTESSFYIKPVITWIVFNVKFAL